MDHIRFNALYSGKQVLFGGATDAWNFERLACHHAVFTMILVSVFTSHCKRSLSLVGPVRMLQFGSLNLLIMMMTLDDDCSKQY